MTKHILFFCCTLLTALSSAMAWDSPINPLAAKVCNAMSSPAASQQCSKQFWGTYFETKALHMCLTTCHNTGLAICLKTIANKIYLNDIDLLVCHEYPNCSGMNSCLYRASSEHRTLHLQAATQKAN